MNRRDIGPLRRVTAATYETRPKFKRGIVAGRRIVWTVQLECGHVVKRVADDLVEPSKARCSICRAAEVEEP